MTEGEAITLLFNDRARKMPSLQCTFITEGKKPIYDSLDSDFQIQGEIDNAASSGKDFVVVKNATVLYTYPFSKGIEDKPAFADAQSPNYEADLRELHELNKQGLFAEATKKQEEMKLKAKRPQAYYQEIAVPKEVIANLDPEYNIVHIDDKTCASFAEEFDRKKVDLGRIFKSRGQTAEIEESYAEPEKQGKAENVISLCRGNGVKVDLEEGSAVKEPSYAEPEKQREEDKKPEIYGIRERIYLKDVGEVKDAACMFISESASDADLFLEFLNDDFCVEGIRTKEDKDGIRMENARLVYLGKDLSKLKGKEYLFNRVPQVISQPFSQSYKKIGVPKIIIRPTENYSSRN